jgi:hypothetical protein
MISFVFDIISPIIFNKKSLPVWAGRNDKKQSFCLAASLDDLKVYWLEHYPQKGWWSLLLLIVIIISNFLNFGYSFSQIVFLTTKQKQDRLTRRLALLLIFQLFSCFCHDVFGGNHFDGLP